MAIHRSYGSFIERIEWRYEPSRSAYVIIVHEPQVKPLIDEKSNKQADGYSDLTDINEIYAAFLRLRSEIKGNEKVNQMKPTEDGIELKPVPHIDDDGEEEIDSDLRGEIGHIFAQTIAVSELQKGRAALKKVQASNDGFELQPMKDGKYLPKEN